MKFERGKDPLEVMDIKSYIYDNGFGPRWFVCGNAACLSVRQERKILGGFQPPEYICKDCETTNYAPCWINLDRKTLKPYLDNIINYRDPATGKLVMHKR